MSSIRETITKGDLPTLEIHLLWQHILGVSRAWVIAHDTDTIDTSAYTKFKELYARRLAGEPMAYILGYREFFGYKFTVSPDVLIPRPETELLVQLGLEKIASINRPKVLDLGTGSGAIAIAIALQRPDAEVIAIEQSPAALEIAQKNAHDLGAKLKFYNGNWYDTGLPGKLPVQSFDVIVSNPPYVEKSDPHLHQGDLRFEPQSALTDFDDGLNAIRNIIKQAPDYLQTKGSLYIEHGWDQAAHVRSVFDLHGFKSITTVQDLAGIDRVTYGILNA